MRIAMARVLGLIFAVGGAAFLIFLAEVSFQAVKPWSDFLVAIGMPLMLMLVLIGCSLLGLGLWLLLKPARRFTPLGQ